MYDTYTDTNILVDDLQELGDLDTLVDNNEFEVTASHVNVGNVVKAYTSDIDTVQALGF